MFKSLAVVLALLGLAACSTTQIESEAPSLDSIVEYTIGVGDQLNVSVWKNPELSTNVLVRPDGKISVPLIGDIVALGTTAEGLADDLETALENYVRGPQVTVVVAAPVSAEFQQRVRVTGAVNAPQSVPYRSGMTVLDVVLQAGGLTPFASANRALLYRKTNDGIKAYTVRLRDILEQGKLDTNYDIAPSDILTVPSRAF